MAATEARLPAVVFAERGVSHRCRAPLDERSVNPMALACPARGFGNFCSPAALPSARAGLLAVAVAGGSRVHRSEAWPRFCRRLLARSRTLQVSNRAAAGIGAALDARQKHQERAGQGLHPGCTDVGGSIGSHLWMVSLQRLSKVSAVSECSAIRRGYSPGHGEHSRIDLLPLSQ